MKLKIYSIYDAKVDAYSQPFYSPTNGSALRAFSDHVNEAGSNPNKHPEDYYLYELGEFNDQDGTITGNKPTRLGGAAEYLKKEN
ncbi:MAG: nonstructural protein [Microvirus sp.]|nr:MAG: nonstructural protein [Microvirus sp.]